MGVLRIGVALGLLLMLVSAPGASAHALLTGSTPERGATVKTQPDRVSLTFSESVEGSFGALRVFDADAERVDAGGSDHPGGKGNALAVGLKPGLPDGTYVATYRVISADSHPVSGGLVFSIGTPGAAAAPTVSDLIGDQDAGAATEIGLGTARGGTYLATALMAGGLLFFFVVWLPALRQSGAASEAWRTASLAFAGRLRALLLGGVAIGIISGAGGIVAQGAIAGGTSFWSALDPDVVSDVLYTRFGTVWIARMSAFAVLGAAVVVLLPRAAAKRSAPALQSVALGADGLAVPGPSRAGLALAVIPAGFILAAPALGGHASVQKPVAVLTTSDILHVIAMSAWIGGLVALLLVLPTATRRLDEPADRTRLLAGCLARFSPVALGAVVVLLVTGVLQSILHIEALDRLTSTGFGRAVLIKSGLIVLLIGLGFVNERRVIPRLRALADGGQAPGGAGRLVRRTLRAEVALVVVVLGVTSALVSYPPPDASASGPYSADVAFGPLRLEATVDPARAGANEAHLYLLHAGDGAPFERTKEITVTVSLPDKRIGPLPATARLAGPGHYVLDTLQLAPAGAWAISVVARVSEFDQYETTLEVDVR